METYKGCKHCLHYRPDGTCIAFDPGDIPLIIASGQIKHDQPLPNQGNSIVYEMVEKNLGEILDEYMERTKSIRARIEIVEGDISCQAVDAIVNAANESLMAGGGVSGAIHRNAGPGLEEECLQLKGCEEGQAKVTKGYNLPAKWVIHTVGPVWEGGNYNEDKILSECYRNCFALIEEYKIKTLAFPAISAGVYGFPIKRAATIAIREARRFLEKNTSVEKVIFVCYEQSVYSLYQEVMDDVLRVYS
jgi:O-acetyl-ADP-ribose deacetylase